jgi:hypothetical protein
VSTFGPEARALFEAGRDALHPTVADRERNLAALRALTGDAVEGAAAVATSGFGWPAISATVLGLAVAGGLLVYSFQNNEATAPAKPKAVLAVQALAAARPALPVPPVEPASNPALSLPPDEARFPAKRGSSERLAEEVALLSRAQTDLHAGRFSSALRLLGEHERKFPRGTLVQERVAARVRALCALGRVKEADAELVRVSPGSLHEGRLREACSANSRQK